MEVGLTWLVRDRRAKLSTGLRTELYSPLSHLALDMFSLCRVVDSGSVLVEIVVRPLT